MHHQVVHLPAVMELQEVQQAVVAALPQEAISQPPAEVEGKAVLTIHAQQAVMLRNMKALIFLQEVKLRKELQVEQ